MVWAMWQHAICSDTRQVNENGKNVSHTPGWNALLLLMFGMNSCPKARKIPASAKRHYLTGAQV